VTHDPATCGLRFTMKNEKPAYKEKCISKSEKLISQPAICNPKYHSAAIKRPKRIEFKEAQAKIFPGADEKPDLVRESNQITQLNAGSPPSSEDLQEDGVDVVFTDEIKLLADSLTKDPVKIYEYVKNNFEYQPYWGSLKGAHETLLGRKGNDTDLASLLIALFRYSGYPARYAEAKAIVDIKRAKNWLGVDDDSQAGYLLATAGVPEVEDLYRGSQLVQVKFKHVYVEVYLPYDNYRGQMRIGGGSKKFWVPLSPSFKKNREAAGIDLQAAAPFNAEAFLQQLKTHTATGPDGSITGMDAAFINSQMEAYGQAIADFVNTHNPDMTLREYYGYQDVIKENDSILPITLPFAAEEATHSSKLFNEQRHRIAVKLSYHGIDLDEELDALEINYSAPTAQVAGKRLTLSYRPATLNDEQLLGQYDGNFLGTPLYLIHLYPQLKVDGRVVAENTGMDAEISMGLDENLRVEMIKPGEIGPAEKKSDYLITAGDHVAIVPGLGNT
ncbi:MAG: transglutaminase-like domain-containing protein, partial [Pseudomonadota bacterium]